MDKDLVLASYFLDQALDCLTPGIDSDSVANVKVDDVERALAQTLKLCDQGGQQLNEPVRTLHHLSCTGGTLLTKCIASMANVLVLNEIDFASSLTYRKKNPAFSPTDMISLLRQGDENPDPAFIQDLFVNDISVLLERQVKIGRTLLLRDHSHSHFLVAHKNLDEPTLYETTKAHFDIKPLVSVRDPVDSYASMVAKKWHGHFSPSTFDEYCRRYLLFLDRHADIPIIKYEDFVAHPRDTMQIICEHLTLDYFPNFPDVFDSFTFSGDSGRKGALIEPRESREITPELQEEMAHSHSYQLVCERLGYEPR